MKQSKLTYPELVEVFGFEQSHELLNQMILAAETKEDLVATLKPGLVCSSLQSVGVTNSIDKDNKFTITVFFLIKKPSFFTSENPSLEINPLVIYLSDYIEENDCPDFVLDLMSLQQKIKSFNSLDESWLFEEVNKLPNL